MPITAPEKLTREAKISWIKCLRSHNLSPNDLPELTASEEKRALSPLMERKGLKIEVKTLDEAIEVLRQEKGKEIESFELFYDLHRAQINDAFNQIRAARPELGPLEFCFKIIDGINLLAGYDFKKFNILNLSLTIKATLPEAIVKEKELSEQLLGIKTAMLLFHIGEIPSRQISSALAIEAVIYLIAELFEKEKKPSTIDLLSQGANFSAFIEGLRSLFSFYKKRLERLETSEKIKSEEAALAQKRKIERQEERWIEIEIEEAGITLRIETNRAEEIQFVEKGKTTDKILLAQILIEIGKLNEPVTEKTDLKARKISERTLLSSLLLNTEAGKAIAPELLGLADQFFACHKAEAQSVEMRAFLSSLLSGLKQLAMADKRWLSNPEGQTALLQEIKSSSPQKQIDFIETAYRWGKLVEALQSAPEETVPKAVKIDINTFLANYSGERSETLKQLTEPGGLEAFAIGYQQIIKEEMSFDAFVEREFKSARAARTTLGATYPSPIKSLIAAGNLYQQVKDLAESDNRGEEFQAIIAQLVNDSVYSSVTFRITLDKFNVIQNAITSANPNIIRVMISIYDQHKSRPLSDTAANTTKDFIYSTLLQMAQTAPLRMIPILLYSLALKSAEKTQDRFALAEGIEASIIQEIPESIKHVITFYDRLITTSPQPGFFARLFNSSSAREEKKIRALEELLARIIANTSHHLELIDFLKSDPSALFKWGSYLIRTIFNHYQNSSPSTALQLEEEYYSQTINAAIKLTDQERSASRLMIEVKSLTESNPFRTPPSKKEYIAYQKNIIALAIRILVLEDQLRAERFAEAKKELENLLAAARAANLKIAWAHYLISYVYAGILEKSATAENKDLLSSLIGNPENGHSLINLKTVEKVIRDEIFTALGKDYKDLAMNNLLPEILLYGLIISRVEARRSIAARIISVLRENQKLWENLLLALEDQEQEKVSGFIDRLIIEAKKAACVMPDPNQKLRLVKDSFPFAEENLKSALKKTSL